MTEAERAAAFAARFPLPEDSPPPLADLVPNPHAPVRTLLCGDEYLVWLKENPHRTVGMVEVSRESRACYWVTHWLGR